MDKPKTWTTEDEIKFINGIGGENRVKASEHMYTKGRAELLEDYLDFSNFFRCEWGNIEKDIVIQYAKDSRSPTGKVSVRGI